MTGTVDDVVDEVYGAVDATGSRASAVVLSTFAIVATLPVVQEVLARVPNHPEGFEWAIVAGVAVLVYGRVRASDRWFAPNTRLWYPLRRYALPVLKDVFSRIPLFYATTGVADRELVATVRWSVDETIDELVAAGYEPQPLASIKTDDAGRVERFSMARYYGPKPFEGLVPSRLVEPLPDWTRRRQVHARGFADVNEGPTTIAGHAEYNPWRPSLAVAHMIGPGWHPAEGVDEIVADLDLRDRPEIVVPESEVETES